MIGEGFSPLPEFGGFSGNGDGRTLTPMWQLAHRNNMREKVVTWRKTPEGEEPEILMG